ncbi:MAG: ParB/RepB/Spo0J family partition protein [Oscillospiraceae bacterium]|nr:ParB/RepB/Spo0J family partition protein [Oscillospiraceae bacterium]
MSKLDLTGACKPLADIFASASEREEQRKAAVAKRIIDIEIDRIDDFPEHPFHVRDDEDMIQLVESIREHGVLTPATVTRKAGDRYEMVSGHRRKHACQLAGLTVIPCEIVELSHDDAVLRMVESNYQRSEILPSEKAFAYKMRLEALKRKAGRPAENNSAPMEPNLSGQRSNAQLSSETGESTAQIKRYIRLTKLLPELLEMVDTRQLGFRPAVELSYLAAEEQAWLLAGITSEQVYPTMAQAGKIRRFSASGNLNSDVILSILMESKPQTTGSYKLPRAKFAHYFKEDAKPEEIEDTIEKALKQYFTAESH